MHTRLALATIATVKAGTYILCARQPPPGPPQPRVYTDLAYYGVWGLGDDIKRKSKKERGGGKKEPEPEVKCTREKPEYRLRSKLVDLSLSGCCSRVLRISQGGGDVGSITNPILLLREIWKFLRRSLRS